MCRVDNGAAYYGGHEQSIEKSEAKRDSQPELLVLIVFGVKNSAVLNAEHCQSAKNMT